MRFSASFVAFVSCLVTMGAAFGQEAPKPENAQIATESEAKPHEQFRFLLLPDKAEDRITAVPAQEHQMIPENGTLITCDAMHFTATGTVLVNVTLETPNQKVTASEATLAGASLRFKGIKVLFMTEEAKHQLREALNQ